MRNDYEINQYCPQLAIKYKMVAILLIIILF